MNQRERLLAIIVASLLAILTVVWGYSRVTKSFSRRAGIRRTLEAELERKQKFIEQARDISRQLAAYESISLPSNVEVARSRYQAWLSEILMRAQIVDPQVKVVAQSRRPDGSTLFTVNVSGKGDLRQFTELLHEFYSVETIHRIRVMPVTPIRDSKQLDVNMTIEALILATAERTKRFDTAANSPLARLEKDTLVVPIIERNLFAPANRPPSLPKIEKQSIERGQTLTLSVAGTDPDNLDELTYRLLESPADVRMDVDSGAIVWRPTELGEYEFQVQVADDGIPRRMDETKFMVEVTEPVQPSESIRDGESGVEELALDDAKYTYAIATVEADQGPRLWLLVRTRGTVLRLGLGEKFKVGSLDAKITKIEDRGFEWDRAGERRTVRLGEPLVASDAEPE